MSSIASPITSAASSAAAASTTSTSSSSPTDPLANESTFLTLLVSQLQNQDPLDPTDSNQFISQLTGYSQLEQLIGIHGNTTTLANDASSTTTTPSASGSATPNASSTATPTTTGN